MNSHIKPIKFSHRDFTFERSLRFHLIKRPTTIQSLDFRCIHNNKHRREIYKILKQTKKVNSVSLVVSTTSQPNAIFTLLAQKHGIKAINLNGHSKDKDIFPFLDRQALDWYPLTLRDTPSQNNLVILHDVPISRILPKSITSLKFSLYFISRMSLYRLSQAVKRIRGLKEIELNVPAKNENVLKKDAVIFENMFTFKNKLEQVCFHSHLGRNSLASFQGALKKSPLKSVTIYQDLGVSFDYSAEKLKSFLESQPKLETLEMIVVRKDAGNASVFTHLINAVVQNPHVRNFRFDTQITLDAAEANIIKEALKNFKELRSLKSQFNHNFSAVNAGRMKIDSINLEAAKIRQLTTRTMTVKQTQDPQINLKIIKSLCHDIFNSTQLKHLEITSKIEIHETALLYLLWCVKNMPGLETLKVKTALEVGTMAPMSDIQKMPNFTTPTSLKTLFLEWATEFEYTEKIIDFIALQKNLKSLHLGIMRVGNPSSKDYSRVFSKLATLSNLQSFHILSTSISLFRSSFFDLYTKIVKNSPNLVNIGLTFLAPYLQETSTDALMINQSKIELTPNLCGFLDEIGKKKGVRKLYLNFKINADNEQNLGQLVGLLCQVKGLVVLSICLEMLYKKDLTEDEIKFMKKTIKKQMSRLDHIEYCFLGMLKGLANSPTVTKVLKSAVKKMQNLEGVTLMNGLPLKMNDKLGGNISS